MIFVCDGQSWDTEHLLAVNVQGPGTLGIFITPDFGCVFVVTWNRWEGVSIHRAHLDEIRRLAHRFSDPLLSRALDQATGDDQPTT
jgi:hypothetical protein